MASKINKGEILAKFFDDGEYTALFADGAVSAACGYAAGQQAYAVYQNGEAVTVKDVEKNIKVLEMAAQTGCPVVTFYNSVGAKLAEGLDVLTASAKLNAQIAKVSGVVPQVAVVLGVCGGTSALSAANADVCIMAEGAELFFTAPFTSAAKGDTLRTLNFLLCRKHDCRAFIDTCTEICCHVLVLLFTFCGKCRVVLEYLVKCLCLSHILRLHNLGCL